MSQSLNKSEFWVVNISERNVTLSDLALTIRARSSVNLLDNNHYSYTYEELKESMESGSIFNKRKIIKVGKKPPKKKVSTTVYELSNRPLPRRTRSVVKVEEKDMDYDELLWTDEQYAEEMTKDLDWEFE